MPEESYPVNPTVKVLRGITIYRSQRWLKAVLATEIFGRRSIDIYLWQQSPESQTGQEVWKRMHKVSIRSSTEWAAIKRAVEQLLPMLAQGP
jgi:hypothetical protein